MSDSWLLRYVWLIPALPLLAAVVTAARGARWLRQLSHWPCVVASGLAALYSFVLLVAVAAGPAEAPTAAHAGPVTSGTTVVFHWIRSGDFEIPIRLRVDPLTALMLVMVTGVGALIVVFAVGYMHGDPGYWRFFAEVALFLFSMTTLVLASNFLLLYVAWELVGLCSYLLIGFWYTRPAAAAAAKKAFLVNRVGDFGFALGILLIWVTFRDIPATAGVTRLDYDHAFAHLHLASSGTMLAICLLLFCGAVGKSAQFPLHVWLPDAMEGPTPVSALIHAATMVTAGVYMVARFTPLFAAAPTAQLWVAGMGGFTALLAALIALTQTDLKRILAYSTVSQLGYMFLALGTGTAGGAIAAIFHVFTHAFFKALLFLGAGSVMHAMGNVIDIRRFGGLRARMPITCWTFAAGAASLAGLPLLSGFWSKDEILAGVAARAHDRTFYGVLLAAALATAFLTAFYTFRAFFKAFWGDEVIPPEAGHHAHESPPMMYYPLIVLAVFAVLIGAILGPTGLLHSFLSRTPGLTAAHAEPTHMNPSLMGIASVLAVGGIGLAWGLYGRRTMLPLVLAAKLRPAYELSRNKFWFDEIYTAFIIRPALLLAAIARIADRMIVDSLVDFVAAIPAWFGRYLVRPIQNGLVQFYALAMLMGIVVLVLAMLLG
jgi:NADH-quinone oxidoreductase subunit L